MKNQEQSYDMSHLDLHCSQRYLYWSAGLKGLEIAVALLLSILKGKAQDRPNAS